MLVVEVEMHRAKVRVAVVEVPMLQVLYLLRPELHIRLRSELVVLLVQLVVSHLLKHQLLHWEAEQEVI